MLDPTHKCFCVALYATLAGEKAAVAAALPARRVVLQKAMVKTKMMGALRRFSRAVQKSVSEESVAKGPHSTSQRLQCTTDPVEEHKSLLPAVCLPLKSSPPPPTASVAVRRRSVLQMTMIARVSTSPTSTSRRPSLVDILALGPAVLAAAARERDREEALGHVEEVEEGEGSLSGSLNTMGLGDTEEGGQQAPTEPDIPWADTPQEDDADEPPEGGVVLAKSDSEMSKG